MLAALFLIFPLNKISIKVRAFGGRDSHKEVGTLAAFPWVRDAVQRQHFTTSWTHFKCINVTCHSIEIISFLSSGTESISGWLLATVMYSEAGVEDWFESQGMWYGICLPQLQLLNVYNLLFHMYMCVNKWILLLYLKQEVCRVHRFATIFLEFDDFRIKCLRF